jgi:hypothetical protein
MSFVAYLFYPGKKIIHTILLNGKINTLNKIKNLTEIFIFRPFIDLNILLFPLSVPVMDLKNITETIHVQCNEDK